MPWLNVRLLAERDELESVEATLQEAGSVAVTWENGGEKPSYVSDPETVPSWDRVMVTGLFPGELSVEEVRVRLGSAWCQAHSTRMEALEERDWEREWLEHFHPIQIGKHLWVVPSWCPPPDPEAINLMIDPGLAFGTGTHQSTALCLKRLDQLSADLAGAAVVDIGCGSGILALGALLLGADTVWGSDIDHRALTTARENAKRNGLTQRLHLFLPDELPMAVVGDIVVANILVSTLVSLAVEIDSRVKPGGKLLLSGILAGQESEVIDAFSECYQFTVQEEEGWILVEGDKEAP
tara:strand:- start:6081 stop:6965 length:885 start_codon:yes stop_codon:yes gene_type:complete